MEKRWGRFHYLARSLRVSRHLPALRITLGRGCGFLLFTVPSDHPRLSGVEAFLVFRISEKCMQNSVRGVVCCPWWGHPIAKYCSVIVSSHLPPPLRGFFENPEPGRTTWPRRPCAPHVPGVVRWHWLERPRFLPCGLIDLIL